MTGIKVKVPANAATSVTAVTLKYKNASGASQIAASLALSGGSQTHATATFTGLTFYVPQNTDANLDVYVGVPTVASGANFRRSAISAVLDYNEGFKAVDSAGTTDTSLAAADLNSAATTGGKGTMYVRKVYPNPLPVALTRQPAAGSDQVARPREGHYRREQRRRYWLEETCLHGQQDRGDNDWRDDDDCPLQQLEHPDNGYIRDDDGQSVGQSLIPGHLPVSSYSKRRANSRLLPVPRLATNFVERLAVSPPVAT